MQEKTLSNNPFFRSISDSLDQKFGWVGEEQEKRIWVPASKIITQPDNESEDLNICVMPKWLYGKTMLPLYTEVVEEFTHVEKIDTL